MNSFIQKIKNKIWTQLLIIYTRYLIGGAFVFASIIKVKGKRFTTESGAEYSIDTAWHLFETMYQSGLYWQFLGISQLVAGFLLMTQRYSKLGALLFLPIIGNIFVITLSYYFAYTPVLTGMMLVANLMLVAWDWNELKVLFNRTPVMSSDNRLENKPVWEWTGLALFIFTAIYHVINNGHDIKFWSLICILIGLVGLGIGLWKHKINADSISLGK
ncbi:hypothetical protein LX73_0646 [Fodinibius salinus]|uniref:DoxX protein n=1 Tax=Fodinibius salinus TaxID=860790 RepID=A0A5D3YMK8_9BACT|nr:hypothetical protein [Fodinibius salinus]TYP95346.1 hypothetical protein LX73_0646 [Fodinibius salinus]